MRVLKKEDGWILRIRDNCVAFNPLRRAEGSAPCDGIRRVHFRKDGTPYFQMSAEEDQPGAFVL